MKSTRSKSIPGIYLITNTVSGTVYVGQARKISSRWGVHRHHLKHGTHHCRYLQKAYWKYGHDAFEYSIAADLSAIDECDLDVALAVEEARVFATHPKTYNLLQPTEDGQVATPETRALLSVAKLKMWAELKGNPDALKSMIDRSNQYRRSPEGRLSQSDAMKIRWQDEEWRLEMGEKLAQSKDTDEFRQKQSNLSTAQWADPEIRVAMVAGLTAGWADSEVKARRVAAIMAGQKKALEDPNSKMSKRFEKRWSNPEERARQSSRTTERWSDTEFKEKMRVALKAGWAKRRERLAALLLPPE